LQAVALAQAADFHSSLASAAAIIKLRQPAQSSTACIPTAANCWSVDQLESGSGFILVQANDKFENLAMSIVPNSATELPTDPTIKPQIRTWGILTCVLAARLLTFLPRTSLSSKVLGLDVYNNANQNIDNQARSL
jgi:hypothetical protein